MIQKEVSELRRRYQPEKTAISHIYGCYVNSQKEIISYIDESLGLMPEDEAGQYLIESIENGTEDFSISVLFRLAEALNVSPDAITNAVAMAERKACKDDL